MKNKIRISLLFGLLCAVFLSMMNFEVLCEDLRQNVLRLHIIANSDTEADQQLKLKIRDAVLSETGGIFETATDLESAENIIVKNLSKIENIANRVIKENGFHYKATVSFDDSFFETRHYDTFSLPAGVYRSLIIKLGDAKGKNWWCVVFPSICLPTSSSDLRQSVNENSAQIAEQSERYIIGFKVVEIFEKVKLKFSNFKG